MRQEVTQKKDKNKEDDELEVNVSELEGKVIGLYFSANWYIPCRNFTQVLANTYNQLKTNGSEFEVVFVSSDEDLDAFNNYYASMPWLAVPFSDLESKKALNRRFDVEGIPCLIILQPNSPKDEAMLREGVEIVYRFGTFSWGITPPKQVPVGSLTGKTVGLYFSAQWCLPGIKFTPKLISIYEKIKELVVGNENEDFEIVLVSSDRDQTEFVSHFNSMPWLALPFRDPVTKHLTKYFDIQGIPCLVILGPDGKTVTKHGRSLVNLYQENAYPFTEAKVGLLEKQMDEEAKSLPRSEKHVGHRHELTLVSEGSGGGPYISVVTATSRGLAGLTSVSGVGMGSTPSV
ncbi:hypothetical protein Acr_21g0010810 [Actinidia rufa]|uniref:protein-disulfide reductase n=1 Tax=Actinidia rufa TaxID=165716 RepID=A0A7J0GIB4_9ERIC|nr:hypothetical protein Acr_21g0010810 [Actinidia rufa]